MEGECSSFLGRTLYLSKIPFSFLQDLIFLLSTISQDQTIENQISLYPFIHLKELYQIIPKIPLEKLVLGTRKQGESFKFPRVVKEFELLSSIKVNFLHPTSFSSSWIYPCRFSHWVVNGLKFGKNLRFEWLING